MATIAENRDAMQLAFSTHMKNKNPGVDQATLDAIDEFALAYASSIADAIATGTGDGGGVIGDFIKKSGGIDGVMSGLFTANAGFLAGWDASNQIATSVNGLLLNDDVDHQTGHFKGHGKQILDHETNTLGINLLGEFTEGVSIGGLLTKIANKLQVGDAATGFVVDGNSIMYKGQEVYHASNSNKSNIDWTMGTAVVHGALTVAQGAVFLGGLTSNYGFEAGYDNNKKIWTTTTGISLVGDVMMGVNGTISSNFNSEPIIKDLNDGAITLNAAGTNLMLGYENTEKVTLSAALYNYNNSRQLISQFGEGNFLWGFNAGYDGDKWFEMTDVGAKANGSFYVGDNGARLESGGLKSLKIRTDYGYVDIGPRDSNNRCQFYTDKDAYYFNKSTYNATGFGVFNTETFLKSGQLLLSADNFLLNSVDGIKHYGNSYFKGTIGTESFSEGFSGTGWIITPDADATFTNLVVRNKLKVYEFEVQKITSINGTFYVSANCSAETVTKL